MTSWVVCGSRHIGKPYTADELGMVRDVCNSFWKEGDTLITGGCIDIDSAAMRHAKICGLHVITMLALRRDWTDKAAVQECSDEVIDTHVGFWRRDTLEVEHADQVLAFPIFELARSRSTSGTWHTWQTARLYGKHTALVVLRPHGAPTILGQEAEIAVQSLGWRVQ